MPAAPAPHPTRPTRWYPNRRQPGASAGPCASRLLPCRGYAEAVNPYGVYAGETQTERAARLQARTGTARRRQRQPKQEVLV